MYVGAVGTGPAQERLAVAGDEDQPADDGAPGLGHPHLMFGDLLRTALRHGRQVVDDLGVVSIGRIEATAEVLGIAQLRSAYGPVFHSATVALSIYLYSNSLTW